MVLAPNFAHEITTTYGKDTSLVVKAKSYNLFAGCWEG
jgi:hypothetical protein